MDPESFDPDRVLPSASLPSAERLDNLLPLDFVDFLDFFDIPFDPLALKDALLPAKSEPSASLAPADPKVFFLVAVLRVD